MAPAIGERTPRITVITPTRNRLEFLREAVASVLSQSFGDWEMIVVDDCSQDGTWNWLQGLGDERIRAIRMQEHRERSAARNAGLSQARGEYVLFLDDDDWLLDGALERLLDAFRSHPEAVGAVGAYIYKNDWGSWNRASHPRRRVFQNVWEDLFSGWVPLQGQTLLRRSALAKAGGWNETMSINEDQELWLRIWRLGHAVLIPQPVLFRRIHPGQTVTLGSRQLSMVLRRGAIANRSEKERVRAGCLLRVDGCLHVAWREHGRGRRWAALRWWWGAVLSAPWSLASAPSRARINEAGWRFLISLLPGDRLVRRLRKAKRAYVRASRGDIRPPILDLPSAKAAHSLDGPPC